MPLTRRGWAVVTGSLLLAGLGRSVGVLELFVLAAGGLALVGAAMVTVLLSRRIDLEGTRRLVPATVHAGADGRVELTVRNRGSRRSPVVTLRDSVVQVRNPGWGPSGSKGAAAAPARQARFHVAPLGPEQSNRAAYRIAAERRGLFRVGPLQAIVGDPFGLVASTTTIAPVTELTVYPRIDPISPPPTTSGHDPRSGGGHPTFLGSGDEFYGLRGYEVGDDLRRVHWPSTARQDELMIRQHEVPWQGRATVLLDLRATAHTEETLDDAVSATASLIHASWKRESQVRLVTTAGLDSGFGSGPGHLAAVMEHLAVADPGGDRLERVAGLLRQRATGALVVVTAGDAGSLGALERMLAATGGYGWAATVVFARRPAPAAAPEEARREVRGRHLVIRVEHGQRFAEVWNAAVATGPPAGRAVGSTARGTRP